MVDIVFDARMINNSGIGTYCQAILPELIGKHDCKVLGDFDQIKFHVPHISFDSVVEFNAGIYSIKEQLLYSRVIPECKIFWTPHYNVPYFEIRANKRLATIHDVYPLAHLDEFNFIQKLYAKIMFNKAFQLSDRIITVSEFSKSEIIKYSSLSRNKIEVIHNALSDKNHLSIPDFKEDALGITGPYLLFVGNVKPHKNLINLVKAFTIVKEKIPDIQLVVIGKKEGFIRGDKEVLNLTKDIDGVIFTGFVSSEMLQSIYINSKALVMPSLYEGFGYPIIEGMFYNIPILASNIEVFKEVAMDAAIYFDPYNEKDIADKILYIFQSDKRRKKLIDHGQIRVEDHFKHERFVSEHLNIVNKLI